MDKVTYYHVLKSEKLANGKTLTRDRFSVLFTCNATRSHQIKPLVIHTYQKSHACRNQDMNWLNVYWATTAKGYMNKNLLRKWLENNSILDARVHCRSKNLNFKVLWFMDNAPGHAKY